MTARGPIHPLWGLAEVAALTACFYFGLWVLGPRLAADGTARLAFWLLVLAGGVHLLWFSPLVLHRDPPALRGWGRPRAAPSDPGSVPNAWPAYAGLTAVMAAVLLGWAWARDPDLPAHVSWEGLGIKFAGYVVFGMVQAFVFFGFVQTRFRSLLPGSFAADTPWLRRAAVAAATAAVFTLYHLPNAPLMACVFPMGLCWSWIFYRRPSVLLLGLSHAVLGTILHRGVRLFMRIGPFYSHPDLYVFRSVIPGLKRLIGDLF